MTIDEAITRIKEFADEQRVKVRTCGNCQYCKKGQIHPRQGYCYFYPIHYEHDLTEKACCNWESNDDIGIECADECEQIAEWLEELKEMWAVQWYVGDFWYERGRQDAISIIFEKLHDFIDEKEKEYGVSCIESRCDALGDFDSWLFEQLKGEEHD